MANLRVHNRSMSVDGYVAGPDQSVDNPLEVGGPKQEYLRAGLVDDLHIVPVPVLLRGGERLFANLDDGLRQYEVVEFVSSPAVTHVRLGKKSS